MFRSRAAGKSVKVPESRAILYHRGNFGDDTKGCNMPGKTKGTGCVNKSGPALDELKIFISSQKGSNVKTIINNNIE